jgi:hypothetical protein
MTFSESRSFVRDLPALEPWLCLIGRLEKAQERQSFSRANPKLKPLSGFVFGINLFGVFKLMFFDFKLGLHLKHALCFGTLCGRLKALRHPHFIVVEARVFFNSFCTIVTWLILPVVICLSQRLSHACLSINNLYTVKLRTAHYISNYLFDGKSLHG